MYKCFLAKAKKKWAKHLNLCRSPCVSFPKVEPIKNRKSTSSYSCAFSFLNLTLNGNNNEKNIKTILIFTLFICKAFGQNNELQNFVDQGVKLYDNGDYKGAIEQYKKALQVDKKSPLANYEISSTYFALKDYEKAIEHSDYVISAKSNYIDQAYILKGTAFDMLGKSKEAIKTYEKAIKEFPNNHLLYYNLGYTSYSLKEYKDAELALQNSLKIKPSHASSHLLLGYVMSEQGNRVKSLLALYNFLLLEPNGNRTKAAYELLDFELKKGVKKENEKSTTITLSDNKESDEFRAAELMLSLLEASKNLEENEKKTEYELFADNTKSFFSVLGELKKDNKGFWWNYYVDFFYSMTNDKHIEAFSYYITQSKEDEKIFIWLKDNKDKVEALSKWYSNYNRKF
ncbi:MAG: tetratricopeptide repeat protein [Bacteroidetes bacterium]|nr:tetratricopeptide repeat protein [Bacteroidota bacterium]